MSSNKKKHLRDLKIIFSGTYILYTCLGVLGYISTLNKVPKILDPKIYIDYMQTNMENSLLEILILVKFISVSPFFIHIAKQNFYSIFSNDIDSIGFTTNQLANFTVLISAYLLSHYNISAKKILGSSGAIIGFMLVYYIPIKVHLKCLFSRNCNLCLDNKNQKQKVIMIDKPINQSYRESLLEMSSSSYNRLIEVNRKALNEDIIKVEKHSACAKYMEMKQNMTIHFAFY